MNKKSHVATEKRGKQRKMREKRYIKRAEWLR